MKLKKVLSFLFLFAPIIIFIACQKDELIAEDYFVNNGSYKIPIKKMSSSCSGTESSVKSISIEYNPNYFSRVKIAKIRTYFCDNNPIGVDTLGIVLDDYYQGSEPEPGPQMDIVTFVDPTFPNYGYATNCSTIKFSPSNILSYNSTYFQSRAMDAAMVHALFEAANSYQYEYGGTYIIDDLDGTYGNGSKDKLIFAVFGHFLTNVFGVTKAGTFITNVPAGSGFGVCDQVKYKNACALGSSNYSSNSYMSYEDVYNYYLNEIAAYRM